MTDARVGGVLVAAVGALGWCATLGAVIGGDPMIAVEIAGAALGALWAGLVIQSLVQSHRLTHALSLDAREVSLFGVRCRVTPALGSDAVVVGSFNPRIYVGTRLLAALSVDELQAVVLHEDHHRRTRAPLRAAALGAWLRLLGRSETVRHAMLDRLADLETMADADAIRRGSSARSLARALLKGDLSVRPVAFTYAAHRRVEHLVDRAVGSPVEAANRLPYEWLPMALLAVAALVCHATL